MDDLYKILVNINISLQNKNIDTSSYKSTINKTMGKYYDNLPSYVSKNNLLKYNVSHL